MRFCPSCGAELIPGNRFCVQCGAPVEPPVSPVQEIPPQVPSPGSPSVKAGPDKKTLILIGVVAVCIILAVGVYFALPLIKPGASSASASKTPVSVTPTGYAAVQTMASETQIIPVQTSASNIVDSNRFGSDYERVYSLKKNFSYGEKVITTYNLEHPPLYIWFNLEPVMVQRHILVSIGSSAEHMVNKTVASPNAWFEVKVLDSTDGRVVDLQGYGKDYPDMTENKFMVRQSGNYTIEMSGHEVYADVTILTGTQ
ncbi:zinc-ribbon domain-containing protein [Methanoregula sp.]|uniref:zinc-ribbon domain-containing protein n=1 Tax=Methanoregula sp. TaxID=2052170 RepID=UPI0035696293